MKLTKYPTLAEALHVHATLIQNYGGPPGVRDLGLLESALARPRSGFYSTLREQAAALFQSLCQNHAFIDGNKRVAFALTAIFLRMNGYRLKVATEIGYRFIIEEVIKNRASLAQISDWLSDKLSPVP